MEEQALYRAILASPHDDMPRLVYADWLDENADAFPAAQARGERGRAEFIRLQCKIARLALQGWEQATPSGLSDPALAKQQARLLFHHGRKWRRAFPASFSSAPFDRGFLRPMRAMRPQEFLEHRPPASAPSPLHALPLGSPLPRYVPDEPFAECPLWDLHLYASGWQDDSLADVGQYAGWLAEVGRSPQMERVGWLKLSFFQTSTVDFLGEGNFPNVETLVLNCVPFPTVLEAIAENQSFRSLRYIHFGPDRTVWAPNFPVMLRYFALHAKIREANNRNLPYGEMRPALRSILRNTPLVPVPPPSPPSPNAFLVPPLPAPTASAPVENNGKAGVFVALFVCFAMALVRIGSDKTPSPPPPPTMPAFKVPNYQPFKYDPQLFKGQKIDSIQELLNPPKNSPELDKLLKRIREKKPADSPDPFREALLRLERERKDKAKKPAEAPPPRPVERKE